MSAKRAFVVGWPIAHSRSPLIHRFWLKRHALDGDYVAEAIPPEAIGAFLSGFAKSGYVGGNVTLPHKEAAFRAAAAATEVARRLEAANTLWLEEGQLHADNTDAYGFVANLDERAPAWRKASTALVIGAGGASRAVLHGLIEAGFRSVVVLNRTVGARRGSGQPLRRSGPRRRTRPARGGNCRCRPHRQRRVRRPSRWGQPGHSLGLGTKGRDRDRPRLRAARHALPDGG